MAKKTYLDEIIDYPIILGKLFLNSQKIIGLLYNNPNIDIQSDEVQDTVFSKHIFDYFYVDETQQSVQSFLLIETEFPRFSSATIKDIVISIGVVCHREHMRLDPKIFKGIQGNRRDNLVREIDYLIRDNQEFGIGKPTLKSIRTITVGSNKYSAKVMEYVIKDFGK